MERQEVASSNISSIGYDPSSLTLEVAFRTGRVYQFNAIPQATHDALMASESKGKFFDSNIRWRFPYERVE